jgi:AraC-like DNA-binding protein
MARDKQLFVFKSISDLMRKLELPKPVHPMAALINYSNVKIQLANAGNSFSLDFYKISFKTNFKGQIKYGQGYYDFDEGGLAFLAPHQIVTMPAEQEGYEGYSFFFHPDLIKGYQLGKQIAQFGFFSYGISEALYLSDKEKKIISTLFEAIESELNNNTDQYSQDVLVSQIELLLNYSNRFYNRQFITRRTVYNDLITKMNNYLSDRLEKGDEYHTGVPTVVELSQFLGITPRYLTDLLKSLTGLSAQQHIHEQLIEKAKIKLSHSKQTVAEIAYHLGFEHPQSFSKFFKQKTNMSPIQFRETFE